MSVLVACFWFLLLLSVDCADVVWIFILCMVYCLLVDSWFGGSEVGVCFLSVGGFAGTHGSCLFMVRRWATGLEVVVVLL